MQVLQGVQVHRLRARISSKFAQFVDLYPAITGITGMHQTCTSIMPFSDEKKKLKTLSGEGELSPLQGPTASSTTAWKWDCAYIAPRRKNPDHAYVLTFI